MPQEVLTKTTQTDLETLKSANLLKNFYLAGGTALALQLKHRLSIDLDFFSKADINTKQLIQKLQKIGKISVDKEAENTLNGRFNKTKIMFLKYDYPLVFPLKTISGIKIADARDIACMKISAVSQRGAKKDFIDLFIICKNIMPLDELLALFEKKYKNAGYNMLHILKSLIFFEDAEKEPMPKMLTSVSWKQVKSFFQEYAKNKTKTEV